MMMYLVVSKKEPRYNIDISKIALPYQKEEESQARTFDNIMIRVIWKEKQMKSWN